MSAMNIYTPTYLYIKKHTVTGLRYFGKTIKNPVTYCGSGKLWTRHIKKHGKEHVVTEWYQLFESEEELVTYALTFSKDNDIVNSAEWANLMEENGISGGYVKNNHLKILNKLPRSKSHSAAISAAHKLKNTNRLHARKHIQIDDICFVSMRDAAKFYDIPEHQIYRWVKLGKAVKLTG